MLLALAQALVLVVELLSNMITAATPTKMKDLQIHNKPPKFNGDPEMFSWWKTKMYSHIMGMDDELWDILEEGVGDLKLDEEGAALDRKSHTAE